VNIATQTSVQVEAADTAAFLPGRGLRELAYRVSGGMEIRLYWNADEDSTSVEVWQPASGELLLLEVPRERALEAFYHPFADLPRSLEALVAGEDG
jgi:hypothetical protein